MRYILSVQRSPIQVRYHFFFNDTATTEIYTLSLHDALPIYRPPEDGGAHDERAVLDDVPGFVFEREVVEGGDVPEPHDRSAEHPRDGRRHEKGREAPQGCCAREKTADRCPPLAR